MCDPPPVHAAQLPLRWPADSKQADVLLGRPRADYIHRMIFSLPVTRILGCNWMSIIIHLSRDRPVLKADAVVRTSVGGGSGTAKQLSPVPSTVGSWLTVGIAIRFLSQAYPSPFSASLRVCIPQCPLLGEERTLQIRPAMSAYDAVDGAHSAASKCQRVVA